MDNIRMPETGGLEGIFSYKDMIEIEVAHIIEHILANGGNDFIPGKTCGGSDLRDMVISGMRGELGEKYRLLKYPCNQSIIKEFSDMILDLQSEPPES